MLGLATYCERAAIPNLAKLVHSLRALCKRNTPYIVTDAHREAFKKFKEAVILHGCSYYRHDWVNRLIVDASPHGLGLVHIQYNPTNPKERRLMQSYYLFFSYTPHITRNRVSLAVVSR